MRVLHTENVSEPFGDAGRRVVWLLGYLAGGSQEVTLTMAVDPDHTGEAPYTLATRTRCGKLIEAREYPEKSLAHADILGMFGVEGAVYAAH